MKNYTLLLLSICCSLTAISQSIINAGNFNPHSGSTNQLVILLDTLSSRGGNGANQTWDFRSLGTGVASNANFMLPAGMPGASRFNADLCAHAATGTSDYFYYRVNNTSIRELGHCDASGNTGIVVTNPASLYAYPLSYGNTVTEQINARNTDIASGGYDDLKGLQTWEGVGYGTLMLPSGTFTNVLKVVHTTIDTDYFSGTLYSEARVVVTEWLYPGINHALLSSTFGIYDYGSGTPSYFKSSFYTNKTPLAVNASLRQQYFVSCFPNPAKENMILRFSLAGNATVTVRIFTMNGQVAGHATQVVGKVGVNTVPVATHDLPDGNYMLDLNVSGVHIYDRFVKQ